MVWPAPLSPNDAVAIVAPSGQVTPEHLADTISWIKQRGYSVELTPHLYGQYQYGYPFSGTPEQRIEDLQWAINRPNIKMIWAGRGGYGAVHLLDVVDFSPLLTQPKWLVGYSDITALHMHLNRMGIVSMHGIHAKPFSSLQDHSHYQSLLEALEGHPPKCIFPNQLSPLTAPISGRLLGGNLSLWYSLMGSNSFPDLNHAIWVIEDLCESHYHVDRMLNGLWRSGSLSGLQGVIIGSFTKMDEPDSNPQYHEAFDPMVIQIIGDFFNRHHIPCWGPLMMGHVVNNPPILLGADVVLSPYQPNEILMEWNHGRS